MNATAHKIGKRPLIRLAPQALLVLLAAAALLWLVSNVTPRGWRPPEVTLTLAGQLYRVSPDELRRLEELSALHFTAGEQAAREIVSTEIRVQLDRIFAHARERLPAFADWYYSLRGEYSRAAMTALSWANLAEPGYVANQAAAMLLPEDVWTADLKGLEHDTAERLRAHQAQVRDGWLAALTQRLSAHRVPAPLPIAPGSSARGLMLDDLLQDIVARERAALNTRLSLSTVAAGGTVAAGAALWRAAAARASTAGGRAAAARAAARGASRAAPAATGAAAICSPGGPAAFGCALFAGAAVWLATDWALLRVDEHLNRDELVSALEAGLSALREQIEHDLLDAYEGLVARHYDAVGQAIDRGFVPARAGETAD